MGGGLGATANRNDVWVIRNEGGKRQVYTMDLQSKSCFDSPAFYLQQNDIVYVKPMEGNTEEKVMRRYQYVMTAITSLSTISTMVYLIKSLGNK